MVADGTFSPMVIIQIVSVKPLLFRSLSHPRPIGYDVSPVHQRYGECPAERVLELEKHVHNLLGVKP